MTRRSVWLTVAAGLLVALVLVVLVAPHASSSPDGLERVAADQRIDGGERPHALDGGPLAGYAVDGVEDDTAGTALAGTIGVAVVFVATFGLLAVVRRNARRRAAPVG